MRCQFGERQYEYYMNKEFESQTPVFIPDQRFEFDLEIDAATFTRNARFWRPWSRWPFFNWRRGVHVDEETWDLTAQVVKDRTFPKFKCNVFVQYKRPEYISRACKGEMYSHWEQPYFRYRIDQHQQQVLLKLEQRVSSNALVAYACASFWTWADLCKFANGRMIDNSNFAEPHTINGHTTYTFVHSGSGGHGFSEPSDLEGIDPVKRIKELCRKPMEIKDNVDFMKKIAYNIRMTVKELPEPESKAFFLIEETRKLPENEFGRSVVTILNFSLFTNTTWGIGYEISDDI